MDDPSQLLKGIDPNSVSFNALLLAWLIFGCVGMGAWVYGKRQKSLPHMLIAVALMAYPCFANNLFYLYGVGIALTAALFVFKP
ncbi:MAG TPA: hypothetical protein VG733_03305 [Chthoniobacteraceae bacterium]|nr:hypothetical protein [Chthoniobacteraceae bacterium]